MAGKFLNCDCMEGMKAYPDESVSCCVTSPPYYGLRDYGVPGQIGLETTPEEYISRLVDVFREVKTLTARRRYFVAKYRRFIRRQPQKRSQVSGRRKKALTGNKQRLRWLRRDHKNAIRSILKKSFRDSMARCACVAG